jgi:F-type H+-transporting ATPase subunit gamma
MQITKAMELVATSKLRRAKERIERARPYRELLSEAIMSIAGSEGCTESPFTAPESRTTLILAIVGDRGLAGGYNANVYRTVAALPEIKGDYLIAPVGKKAREYYAHRGAPTVDTDLGVVADIGVGDCKRAADRICRLISDGKIGRIIIVYTKFKSMISQVPVAETVFPLSPAPDAKPAGDPILSEDPEEFIARVMPDYLTGVIYSAICEASASESGARRTSMNAANKNAQEMIDSLMLKFNRARQAVITQEITEIVSGAEAL